jgi:adenylate cyclase
MGTARRLVEQLRKRKVLRVGAGYAVIGWLAMQVADVMFPALGLPAWTVTLAAALLIVGFPVALALAWMFDVTPDGIRVDTGTSGAQASDPPPPHGILTTPSPATDAPRAVGTAAHAGTAHGVAVLPFLDLSAARDNEYFSDGLTEELLNVLCSVEGLRVSSRTSCFNLKGKDIDIPAVASRLKVSHIVEGGVRKSGNRVRITAQLIEAATDSHLWSDTWDRDLDDIFAIQQDIARKIVEALRLRLDPRALPDRTTRSVQAYDSYLRGRSFVHKFGPKSLGFAIEQFRRATDIDPGYARGWAGLAEAHAIRAIYYDTDAADCGSAETASRKALELAPGLAEAHVARGIAYLAAQAYADAEREFITAIEIAPQMFEGYYYAGRSCIHQGQLRRALEFFEHASAVSPEDYNVPLIAAPLVRSLGDAARSLELDRRGIELAERHLEANPDSARPYYLGAAALMMLGQPDKALDWARRAIAIDPEDPATLYNVACFYAQAGRIDDALECLEKGVTSKTWLENDPELDPIREHARFKALLARCT